MLLSVIVTVTVVQHRHRLVDCVPLHFTIIAFHRRSLLARDGANVILLCMTTAGKQPYWEVEARAEFATRELARKRPRVKELDAEIEVLRSNLDEICRRIAFIRNLQADILDDLPLEVLSESPSENWVPSAGESREEKEKELEDEESEASNSFLKTQPARSWA